MPEAPDGVAYVFGYGSLVAMGGELTLGGRAWAPVPGRLRGYRRYWGAAMNNWEAGPKQKHFLDPDSGEQPRIRVAYLDIEEESGRTVNGLAVPVDRGRLAEIDGREMNYLRIDVSDAFEPALPQSVFAYRATEEARERCRRHRPDAEVFVSSEYVAAVRRAFAELGEEALEEFDRTTDPLDFPQRHLRPVYPAPAGAGGELPY
ncbi:MAG TPA: gamma-glutamylcyclotransferase family protein [Solirubrobacterales bacterium]|nr:gamma-glutamylcyclotransferase family protein [Solirubrobacterales bacterium]